VIIYIMLDARFVPHSLQVVHSKPNLAQSV
jgi:hypothetical protein